MFAEQLVVHPLLQVRQLFGTLEAEELCAPNVFRANYVRSHFRTLMVTILQSLSSLPFRASGLLRALHAT